MVYPRILGLGVGAMVLAGCPDDGEPIDSTGPATTSASTGSDVTATTIPLPLDTTGEEGSATAADSTTDPGESTGPSGTSSTGPADSSGGSSSGQPDDGTTEDPGVVYDVEWCRLQYPPSAFVAVSEAFTVYVRFYAAGLTDQSSGNDPAPELVVEMGYGVDGSNPATGMGAPWTWLPAGPNVGWDDAVEPNNDEYQGDVVIDVAGIYDYAARISGDSGSSWVYCDLDDLLTGGYTTDQAGHAEVGQ